MMRNLHRRLLLAAALLPAIAAGGCVPSPNRGVESVHQPVVSRADYALDLAKNGDALAPGEASRLSGWLDGLRLGYGDRVAVDDPTGAARAQAGVAQVVAERGLLLADTAPVTPGVLTPGTLRVVVSRMTASVPGCPDWSRMAGSYFDGGTGSNYGCASNTNLAAMVASPTDLVQGANSARGDVATSYKAIDAYRKAPPTGGGGTTVKSESTGSK